MSDTLVYGLNFPASDMKNMLEQNSHLQNGIRTWTQLFGNAGLGAGTQTGALQSDYSDAIAQAYKANYEANNRIIGSGLSDGAVRSALRQNSATFQSAYDTAMQNYLKNMASIQENYANETSAIDEGLTTQAKNLSSLYDYALQYATDELGAIINQESTTVTENGKNGKTTTTTEDKPMLSDYGLDWVYNTSKDENGNTIRTVKSREQIGKEMFTNDGQLTDKGRQLYDFVFNGSYQNQIKPDGTNVIGFDEWLSGKDAELRDWYVGADINNYTFAGTNKGTAQQLLGLNSDHNLYNQKDYEDITKNLTAYTPATFSRSRLDEKALNNIYATIQKKQQDAIRNQTQGKGKGTGTSVENDYARLEKEWNVFADDVRSQRDKLLKMAESDLGKDYANFVKDNQELLDTLDKALKFNRGMDLRDDSLYTNIESMYDELLRSVRGYIGGTQARRERETADKKHGY